ncbi:MAG TPA: hypothetical protein PLW65_05075 [Pseudomonadota bacterium]|nr:hypothetical protein [Pseudomonadota bacterium]
MNHEDPLAVPLPGQLPGPVRVLAEELNAHLPLRQGDQRIVDPRFVIYLGAGADPHFTVVQRLRLGPGELPQVVAEVRRLLAARGRRGATWELGPSSQPAGLAAGLRAFGMRPDPLESEVAGMVLMRPPAPPNFAVAEGITVERVVRTPRLRQVQVIFSGCFGTPLGDSDPQKDFARYQASPSWRSYIALHDGQPIAAADATFTDEAVVLSGGATLPALRRRGAYQALIAARWRDAVARGTPILVTQAGRMSRPILARLGFSVVAQVQIFLDEMRDPAPA